MLLSIYLYLWPKTDMLQTFLYRIHEKSWCGTRIRMSIEFRRHVEWLVSTSWYVDACNKFMKRISWLTTWGPAGVSSTTSIVTSDLCPESSKFKDLVIPSILVWEKKREIIKKKQAYIANIMLTASSDCIIIPLLITSNVVRLLYSVLEFHWLTTSSSDPRYDFQFKYTLRRFYQSKDD